jgi:hypothetical protein
MASMVVALHRQARVMAENVEAVSAWLDRLSGLLQAVMVALVLGTGGIAWDTGAELRVVRAQLAHLTEVTGELKALQAQSAAAEAQMAGIAVRLAEYDRRLEALERAAWRK